MALPPFLSNIHNVFHVSQLRKYVRDPTHARISIWFEWFGMKKLKTLVESWRLTSVIGMLFNATTYFSRQNIKRLEFQRNLENPSLKPHGPLGKRTPKTQGTQACTHQSYKYLTLATLEPLEAKTPPSPSLILLSLS
ncbi:hypothetical protein CR513_11005, partial [Mucuna pruriens]